MRTIVWDQNSDNILLVPEGKNVPHGNFVYGILHNEADPPIAVLDIDSFDAPVNIQYFSRLLNAQYGIEVALEDILQESDGEIRMSKTANILDPIHDTLDQRVFNGTTPKLDFFKAHLHHIREVFRQYGFDPTAFDFYLTGSLCTYQYSWNSDVDISISTDHEFSDEDRAELVSIVVNSLDGPRFPGTDYRFQHFIQPEGINIHDLFAIGMRAGYDFQKEEWVVEPSRAKAKDIKKSHPDWIAEAVLFSDKMNTLIDSGFNKEAIEMYKNVHHQRKQDQLSKGDESLGNIIYKFLDNNGTFDRLRNIGKRISHWMPGWHAAILVPTPNGGHDFYVASDPKMTHPKAALDYANSITNRKIDPDDLVDNYWRGLYNPQDGTLAHMSTANEFNTDYGENPSGDIYSIDSTGWEVAPKGFKFEDGIEEAWRNGRQANVMPHPINKFQTVSTENPDEADFEQEDGKLLFLDPTKGSGDFMQQAPHLMRTVRNNPTYWDPEGTSAWKQLYSKEENAMLNEYMKIFDRPGQHTHLNSNGRPCNCGFGRLDEDFIAKQSHWRPFTSSWQILAATPEEVVELIKNNDLKEGSKFDKRFPGAREELLEALKEATLSRESVENTQWAWRHLINIAKKEIQSNIQPILNKKWEQDQDPDFAKNPKVIFGNFCSNLQQKMYEIQSRFRSHDSDAKEDAFKLAQGSLKEIKTFESLFEANDEAYSEKALLFQLKHVFQQIIENDKPQDISNLRLMNLAAFDLKNADPDLLKTSITDEDIKKDIQDQIDTTAYSFGQAIAQLRTIKPLLDRYNIPFNISEFTSFDNLQSKFSQIRTDVSEREKYRQLLDQVKDRDPDEMWQGRVVGRYKLKDGEWTIREVTADDAALEGELMSHCIGEEGQPHLHGLQSGELNAYSVRDPNGVPWATFTMSPDGHLVYECFGRNDQTVRSAYHKAEQADMNDADADEYASKHPMEQEIISKFIEDNWGEDHHFVRADKGDRSGIFHDTPDFQGNREPYEVDSDHPLVNEGLEFPGYYNTTIDSLAELQDIKDWLDKVYRVPIMESFLDKLEGWTDEEPEYDDEGDPYVIKYGDFYIPHLDKERLITEISNEIRVADLADEEERINIEKGLLGLVIFQNMVERDTGQRVEDIFNLRDFNNPNLSWAYQVYKKILNYSLDDLNMADGDDIDEEFGSNIWDEISSTPDATEYNNDQLYNIQKDDGAFKWQPEPSSEIQLGQQQISSENAQHLINLLEPHSSRQEIIDGVPAPIRISYETLNEIERFIPQISGDDSYLANVLQRIVQNSSGKGGIQPEDIETAIQQLRYVIKRNTLEWNNQSQEKLFYPSNSTMQNANWVDYNQQAIPDFVSKWKVSYFENYDVASYNDEIVISDPETGSAVGSIIWFPYGEGNIIQYLGYTDDQGGQLHPNRDKALIEEKKRQYPGLGIEMMRWTRENIPGPYYGAFANQKLRKVLQGEPTGDVIRISPEYAEELGEDRAEIPIDRIRRSKWVESLNGNNAWNPENETQTLDDDNPYQDNDKTPKWKPKRQKWRREPEEIDAQSEALDSPSVEKWLKAASRDNNGVMIAVEPENPEKYAIEGGEPADILHCTLVYLDGDADSFSDEEIEELKNITSRFAQYQDDIGGTLTAMATFTGDGSGDPAQVGLVSCVGLDELRSNLVRAVKQADFKVNEDYGWVPHMTLAYQDDPVNLPENNSIQFKKLTLRIAEEPFDYYFEDEIGEDRKDVGIKDEKEEHPSFDMEDVETIVEDHLRMDPSYYDEKKESAVSDRELEYWNRKNIDQEPNMQWLPLEEFEGLEGNETYPNSDLVDHIRSNGVNNPLRIEYNPDTDTAFLGEGNHRLDAARELGLTELPAIAYRGQGESQIPNKGRRMNYVPPNGRYPEVYKPSDLGFRTNSKWKTSNWDDNIWYHVTKRENLQSVRDHGLAPIESLGQGQNFSLPVGEKVVYLHPNVSGAVSYASKHSQLLEHTGTNPSDWIILRISNIDKRRLLPDHEEFQFKQDDYLDAEPDNPMTEYYYDYMDSGEEEWNGGGFSESLDYLMSLPMSQREKLIRNWSEFHPTSAVMYLGTIPAQNIDIVGSTGFSEEAESGRWNDVQDQWRDYKDYMENMGVDEVYPFDDESDQYSNMFQYKPMFSKWKIAKV